MLDLDEPIHKKRKGNRNKEGGRESSEKEINEVQ